MSEYPRCLYREGDTFDWDGKPTDRKYVADAAEHEAAEKDGWVTPEEYWGAAPEEPSLLDRKTADIEAELPNLKLEELEALKESETAGKTRKGVLAAIDAAIDERLAG